MMEFLISGESIKVLTHARLIDYMTRRPTHFVTQMALRNSVLNLSSGSFRKRNKPGVIVENGWKTKCFYQLPLSRFKIISLLNAIGYKRFLKENIRENDIVWAYEPFTIDSYLDNKRKLLVYEMCDDTSAYFKHDRSQYEYTLKQEEKICRNADIVITISDNLLKKKRHLNENFHVVRNGADYKFFSKAYCLQKSEKDELYGIQGPIIGYHGAISPWIDFALIRSVAEELKNFNFVFVGRINPDCYRPIREFAGMPNVFFLGERRYSDLIHFLKYFDVTIIPFILDELIVSVSPIKMYEYLSAGKPVLSAPLPEVIMHEESGIVETTSSAYDYAEKLQKLYGLRDEPQMIQRRMDLGYNNSWEIRYQELEALVHKTLKSKH